MLELPATRCWRPARNDWLPFHFIEAILRRMTVARRCHVGGRVQGVFYRASTREKAQALGIRGYARNLTDGRVEVLAIGEPQAVQALIQWLWRGPPAAQVTQVEVEPLELSALGEIPTGFTTGRG